MSIITSSSPGVKDYEARYSSSILGFFDLTISTGLIPAEWKDARVTDIFKSGARNDVNNYQFFPWCQRL